MNKIKHIIQTSCKQYTADFTIQPEGLHQCLTFTFYIFFITINMYRTQVFKTYEVFLQEIGVFFVWLEFLLECSGFRLH